MRVRRGQVASLPRAQSATAKRREELKLLIKKVFDDSDGTYGYRRIAWQLARHGVGAGAGLVRRAFSNPSRAEMRSLNP